MKIIKLVNDFVGLRC